MSDEKTTELKNKVAPETENSVTLEMPESLCDARCKLCNSNHLEAIHELKKSGNTFDEIVEVAQQELSFEISKASLSRHFSSYQKQKNLMAAQIINGDLLEEASKQAIHTSKIVALIDNALAHLEMAGRKFDVADLEKLMKLRYQLLSGQESDENDILAIFQKATDKYGLNLSQGILFKQSKRAED